MFVIRDNTTNATQVLEEIGENLIKWFSNNQMKLNADKCHALSHSQGPNSINLKNLCINNYSCENLLGIYFGFKLKLTHHIEQICKKTSQKLNTFARLAL